MIADNVADGDGGGIYSTLCQVILRENAAVRNNRAGGGGGAMYLTTVRGSTISGNASVENNSATTGGAVAASDGGYLTTQCCARFVANRAAKDGGAVYLADSCWIEVANGLFVNNSAGRYGGAMFLAQTGTVKTEATRFVGGVAYGGGAISAQSQSNLIFVQGTTFNHNMATFGGAVLMQESTTVSFDTIVFEGNSAIRDGGAIAMWNQSTATLVNTNVNHGKAVRGGGVFMGGGTFTLTSPVSMNGNTASMDGGAIFMFTAINMTGGRIEVSNNTAGQNAGAIFAGGAGAQLGVALGASLVCNYNTAGGDGGAMYFQNGGALVVQAEACQVECPRASMGDGRCDMACMTRGCGWDGGDCSDLLLHPGNYSTDGLAVCPMFDLVAFDAIKDATDQFAITANGPVRCVNASSACRRSNLNPVQGATQNARLGQWALDLNNTWLFVPISTELYNLKVRSFNLVLTATIEMWLLGDNVVVLSSGVIEVAIVDWQLDVRYALTDGGTCLEERSLENATAGEWMHLALVFGFGETTVVYVNGVPVPTFMGEGCIIWDLAITMSDVVDTYGLAIGKSVSGERSKVSALVDEFRIWNFAMSYFIPWNMHLECGQLDMREHLLVCYSFDNSSLAFDYGSGEPSFGYALEVASATCGPAAWCAGPKQPLPLAGLGYDVQTATRALRRLAAMDYPFTDGAADLSLVPWATSSVVGCATNPLELRGNRARNGGAIYEAACDEFLAERGICVLVGVSVALGSALSVLEDNFAAVAGGGIYVACSAFPSSCAGVFSAGLGIVGLGGRRYRRVLFRNNVAMGYGPDVATAPSRLNVTADQSALVPGQEAFRLEAVLFDGLGAVVAGTPASPVPYVVSVMACGDAGCTLEGALRPPSFYGFGTNLSRVAQDVVCPNAGGVDSGAVRFVVSVAGASDLQRSVGLRCDACLPGQYRTRADGAWFCGSCLESQYNVDPNRFGCQNCPVGAECNGSGLVVSDGSTWSVVGDVYRLSGCVPGRIVVRDNSSCIGVGCHSGPSQDHCYRCPGSPAPGRYSLEAALFPGPLVSATDAAVTEAQCRPCPTGATCELGGDSVLPLPGYWTAAPVRRALDDTPHLYRCRPDVCAGDNQCLAGHTGHVCGLCDDNYTRSGKQCVVCAPESVLEAGRAAGLAVLVVAFVAAWAHVSIMPFAAMVRQTAEEAPAPAGKLRETLKDLRPKISTVVGVLKILLTFYQVASCFWTAFDVPWPERLGSLFRGSSVLMGDVFTVPSFACLSRDWSRLDRLLFYTAVPLAIAAAFGLPYAVACVWLRDRRGFAVLKARFFNAVSGCGLCLRRR